MSINETEIQNLEKKISDVEEILGIDDLAKTKSIMASIEELRTILQKDCKADMLMSIPIKKLEALSQIANKTVGPYGSLAEKIDSIKFGENLIHERAERIKTFSENLEPCLDTELFSKVAELQPELTNQIELYEHILKAWTDLYAECQTVFSERAIIMKKLNEKVFILEQKIQKKIDEAESK